MSFKERIYLPAILSGISTTIKHLFRKKATISYPEVKREFSPVFRGQHVLKRDEKGAERCTACGLCAGYVAHNYWSFANGTARDDPAKVGRFLTSAFLAFVVNTAWVWLLVSALGLPPLAPVPLMMFVTPWVSFFVNRHWVFKAA